MIRIMTADGSTYTTITLDGQLSADSIEAVETCCNRAKSQGKPVRLFLRDVSVIGEDGRELLRRLAANGFGLKASGVYTSYLVQLIQHDRLVQTGPRRCK
jgi:hypothetical protein